VALCGIKGEDILLKERTELRTEKSRTEIAVNTLEKSKQASLETATEQCELAFAHCISNGDG